jgi:hypothetical protein
MGFPGTKSFLVFYDLDVLENGDEVFLTDSEGTKYTYKVFSKYVADPYDWGPTNSVPGKNIVTLQTCTLPDYTQRLIVQAELTGTEAGRAKPPQEAEPAPIEPRQVEPPQGSEPAQQIEPAPIEPAPIEPAPVEPGQVEPAPVG